MSIICFLFGAIIGSFLSVCIYRLPLSASVGLTVEELGLPAGTEHPSLTITSPQRSFCTHCRVTLRWWHNMPLVGWLLLRGRCSFCNARISFRYPFVEFITAGFAVLTYQSFGLTLSALLIFALVCALIVISFIDYDYYIIPNVISLPGAALGLICAGINQFFHLFTAPIAPDLISAALGLACGAGFLFLVSELYFRLRKREGLGMGDVKLLALVGAFLGPEGALFTIFVGSLLGTVGGVLILLILRRGMSHPLPFGPYLAMGTLLYLFLNQLGGAVLLPSILTPMG
ncbi:MAG: prepilin peptidase [Proteobacteria bacterium]|nr:prepilin peptidase [Pseudomonadota bacterium]